MELRCAAGYVDGKDVSALDYPEAAIDDAVGHHLDAIRAGIHMTVPAGLIALLPHVDLKYVDASGLEWKQFGALERFLEGAFYRHLCQQ
jgi:hypothetical protein